jgi:hypothetical protein
MSELAELPWRSPHGHRPSGIPLPPEDMPRRRNGSWLKGWRYVGAFSDRFFICMARLRVGPLGQTFWAVVDRSTGEIHERTKMRIPHARGEVWREAREEADWDRLLSREYRVDLIVTEGEWVEAVCPTSEDNYVWTRKCCDVPVRVDLRIGEERHEFDARAIVDESAGYYPRHTVWDWSAGVGELTDGRRVGWNLVSGINDPEAGSERALWVDGQPVQEPAPVSFDPDLTGITFTDGGRLDFTGEAERRKSENKLLVKYSYRSPFGTFSGHLPGDLELRSGLGVMEHHDAHW